MREYINKSDIHCSVFFRSIILIVSICVMLDVVTTEKPVQASLYQVKKAEKEREGFKKKMSWLLRQLKLFDAKYINKVSMMQHLFGDICFEFGTSLLFFLNFIVTSLFCCLFEAY